jgi:hypothetical protein
VIHDRCEIQNFEFINYLGNVSGLQLSDEEEEEEEEEEEKPEKQQKQQQQADDDDEEMTASQKRKQKKKELEMKESKLQNVAMPNQPQEVSSHLQSFFHQSSSKFLLSYFLQFLYILF